MSDKEKVVQYIKALYEIVEKGDYNTKDAEKVLVNLTLEYNKGNVKKTAELLDVPVERIKMIK